MNNITHHLSELLATPVAHDLQPHPSPSESGILVSHKDAAHRLEISANSLYLRRKRNSLPVKLHKRGGRNFYNLDEINEFMRTGGWDELAKLKIEEGGEK